MGWSRAVAREPQPEPSYFGNPGVLPPPPDPFETLAGCLRFGAEAVHGYVEPQTPTGKLPDEVRRLGESALSAAESLVASLRQQVEELQVEKGERIAAHGKTLFENDDLRAENARLRQALQEIAATTDGWNGDTVSRYESAVNIARAALSPAGDRSPPGPPEENR
jgi:hypothetical protein